MSTGPEPLSAPGIHDLPPSRPAAPFTPQQLKAIGQSAGDRMLATVLFAVSGVEVPVLGKPFAGLATWATQLQDRANDAYLSAFNAQGSANYANAQLAGITGVGLASDVSGGVSISEVFNGLAAPDLGANWTRTPAGPGDGDYGPNGSGAAGWTRSGGLQYTLFDRHTTELTSNCQAVYIVLASIPQEPQQPDIFGWQAYNLVRARINADNDTFVYARIGYNSLRVGCYVDGVETVFGSMSITPKPGDLWGILPGTDIDDYELIVKRNGQIVWRDTDAAHVSQLGPDYLGVGTAAGAHSRPIFTQTIPGETTAFAAADRLPTSY